MASGKRTVLVVDKNSTSIFYLASLLRQLRYVVTPVASGEDALETIAHSAPTVVIADTALPKMGGLDLLKQLKNNASLRFIPVLINTDDASTATREACMQAGCAGYFIKPADPETLFRAIQSVSEATPRKNIRINTSLKARIEAGGAAEGAIRTDEVTSISEGGLYLKTDAPPPVDTRLDLTIILNHHEIAATAVVLYRSEKVGGPFAVPGMGMKFTKIREADVNVIREFIRTSVIRELKTGKVSG
jgi:CheY-like chemotaxis protein